MCQGSLWPDSIEQRWIRWMNYQTHRWGHTVMYVIDPRPWILTAAEPCNCPSHSVTDILSGTWMEWTAAYERNRLHIGQTLKIPRNLELDHMHPVIRSTWLKIGAPIRNVFAGHNISERSNGKVSAGVCSNWRINSSQLRCEAGSKANLKS